jgi:hypothetical protein
MSKSARLAGGVIGAMIASSAFSADESTRAADFSGAWGRNAFNFEPMPSGPQPLTNLSRRPDGTGNGAQLVGDYRNPILKPEAAAVVKAKGELAQAGKGYPDPSNQCRPYAPPFTFAMQENFEILPKKDGAMTIIYSQDDQVRRVRMNATHPANVVPTHMGDSVGHYEGDTLVIDTVGIMTGPVTPVDRWGTPHSDALHVVEHYRFIDGATAQAAQEKWEKADGRVRGDMAARDYDPDPNAKGLQLEVTVEDPNVFTTPWSALLTYRRAIGPWEERVCADNPVEHYPGEWIALPKTEKPDF